MPDFRKALTDAKVYVFDGGYGTLLMQRGLPAGLSPELWGLQRPDVLRAVHEDYLAAGADILTTNTFGGSGFKLPPGTDVAELNRRMVRIAREAAGEGAFVAASIGPTGKFVRPLGELSLRELVAAYMEQIRACAQGGADLILGETHFDLAEAKAVVMAAHEVCDLPVAVSMTFEDGVSLTGSTPEVFVDTMQNLGADAVFTNCSAGPEQMADVVRAMLPRLTVPLGAEANAGLPELDDNGDTVFRLGPEPFAEQSAVFAGLGAKFIGGCCGTGPDHVRALKARVEGRGWARPEPASRPCLVLTTRAESVALGFDEPAVVIGERINPTGKKGLTEDLQQGRTGVAVRLAEEQVAAGARVLDVNVGAPMVDEPAVLPALVAELGQRTSTPLCIDSSDPDAVEAALWDCPGSPLVNSISGEPGKLERLGPVCRRHGAPFILLPLTGNKLPVTAAERLAIVEDMLERAEAMGIPKRLILVDALALTVSSKPEAAKACLEVIATCRERFGLACTLGLSNISFGLPARELLNATFLSLCLSRGLASAIANPNTPRLMQTMASAEVLLARDENAERFIASYGGWTPEAGDGGAGASGAGGGGAKASSSGDDLFDAVIGGDRDGVTALVRAAVDAGDDPFAVVDARLIPAILEVGEKYERKEYFLPQLLRSAEALKAGFAILEPLMEASGRAGDRPVVVLATVEGDIHDIGKNIVALMLGNHGFEVVDLGKDVPAARIVDEAERLGARIIGLSALMTTTMVKMGETVDLVRQRGLDAKVIIGGAVVSREFCERIGADGYSLDAVAAVKLAQSLVGPN